MPDADVWVPGTEPVPGWWSTGVPCAALRCGYANPHVHREFPAEVPLAKSGEVSQ
jgi:hypothetical protein